MVRNLIAVLALVVLGACTATPDLSSWAASSAALSHSVAEQNNAALDAFDEVVVQAEISRGEGWPDFEDFDPNDLKKLRQVYADSSAGIEAGMTAMVQYADAIASLAAAGETGREASKQILSSTQEIANTLKFTIPLAPSAFNAVSVVLGELAQVATTVEAQDSLAETMGALQSTVNSLAGNIQIYANEQKRITSNLGNIRIELLEGEYGVNRLDASRSAYLDVEALLSDGLPTEEDDIRKLELLASQSASYREYVQRVSDLAAWRDLQVKVSDEIAISAIVWARTHQDATNILIKCGGLRSLKRECGHYTAESLREAAGRIDVLIDAVKAARDD